MQAPRNCRPDPLKTPDKTAYVQITMSALNCNLRMYYVYMHKHALHANLSLICYNQR